MGKMNMQPMGTDMALAEDDDVEPPWTVPPDATAPSLGVRLGNVAVWVELGLFTLAPAFGFMLCRWGA